MFSKLPMTPPTPPKKLLPPSQTNRFSLKTLKFNYYAHFYFFKIHEIWHLCAHINPLPIYVLNIDLWPRPPSPHLNIDIFIYSNYYSRLVFFQISWFLHKCAHIYLLPIYVLKIAHVPLTPQKKISPPPWKPLIFPQNTVINYYAHFLFVLKLWNFV